MKDYISTLAKFALVLEIAFVGAAAHGADAIAQRFDPDYYSQVSIGYKVPLHSPVLVPLNPLEYPLYPPQLLHGRIVGAVRMDMVVGVDGKIQVVRFKAATSKYFIESVKAVIPHWRFRPLKNATGVVLSAVTITVQCEFDSWPNEPMPHYELDPVADDGSGLND